MRFKNDRQRKAVMAKYSVGSIVRHKNAKWLAKVVKVRKDYAYGLGKRSNVKINLYKLQSVPDKKMIMGEWGEVNLEKAKQSKYVRDEYGDKELTINERNKILRRVKKSEIQKR